jgi:hypothetical protein
VVKTKQKGRRNWRERGLGETGRREEDDSFRSQAGGNAPREEVARRGGRYEGGEERSGYGAGGSGGLTDEAREGGEVGPNVGEEDEGLTTGLTVDR